MIKPLLTFPIVLLFFVSVHAQTDTCDCTEPTESQIIDLCNKVNRTEYSTIDGFSFTYQEALWKMAGADPQKDDFNKGVEKVQCFWNKYRQLLTCEFSTNTATGKNILKYTLEGGLPGFTVEMVKRYQLDVNFTDYDGETVLDYLVRRMGEMRKRPPVDQLKIDEYQRIHDLIRSKGGKYATEL